MKTALLNGTRPFALLPDGLLVPPPSDYSWWHPFTADREVRQWAGTSASGSEGAWNEEMRVLLVDDQSAFLGQARRLLETSILFEVVGEAQDGAQAVGLVRELQPELVLMDVHMPRMNGVAATVRLVREHPGIRIVLLSLFDDREYPTVAEKAGALGYLAKSQFTVDNLLRLLAPSTT